MAVNIKLGVDMSALKSGIQDANAQIKAFDAQLKVAETTFKKTGDAEAAMSTKTDALTNKLKTQKQMVRQYEEALAKMRANEVDPMSKSYKQLEAAMLNMQSAANETEIQLRDLSTTQLTAASSADKLNNSVSSIGKKLSLDQVITGIGKITDGLENAAKKAVSLGEELFNNVMSRAQWADDTATMALMYGIDLDTFLRMQKLVTNGLDTSVDAILSSQSKLKRGIGSDAKAVSEALATMGISMTNTVSGGKYPIEQAKDSLELFWEVGQKLMSWGDEFQKEDMAQKLFGRGWKELVPLFDAEHGGYKSLEDYRKALNEVNVSSEEDVNALAELNDKVGELKGNLETLSTDILARLAPALTEGADALNGMLTKLMEYLDTPDGQAMLERLGTAVSGLFEDLSDIDPAKVVEGFTSVFEKLIKGLEWLVDNRQTLINALEAVVIGWGALKLTGGALEIMKLINGVQSFNGVNTNTPTVVGGNGETIADSGVSTGAGPGGFWTNALNKLALFGAADAMYQATEGRLRQMMDDFNKRTEGMTDAERAKQAVMENFNMTEEDYAELQRKMNGENGDGVSIDVKPEVPEDASKNIADQVGVVTIPARLFVTGGAGGGGGVNVVEKQANGLPFVPYDGYLAMLHKGERVMTASENKHYTYNSNTYFGSVNLNNGLQVDALAESIARNNRRKNSGYGAQ